MKSDTTDAVRAAVLDCVLETLLHLDGDRPVVELSIDAVIGGDVGPEHRDALDVLERHAYERFSRRTGPFARLRRTPSMLGISLDPASDSEVEIFRRLALATIHAEAMTHSGRLSIDDSGSSFVVDGDAEMIQRLCDLLAEMGLDPRSIFDGV
jgi:hypothetical protein